MLAGSGELVPKAEPLMQQAFSQITLSFFVSQRLGFSQAFVALMRVVRGSEIGTISPGGGQQSTLSLPPPPVGAVHDLWPLYFKYLGKQVLQG